jgi:hypothetical protein
MADDHYELSLQVFGDGEARQKLRAATEVVLSQERAVDLAGEEAAESEALYRLEVGRAFAAARADGDAVEAAKIRAHAETVALSKDRDVKATRLKLAFERLEDARDTRRSLWRLIEWARGRDLANASTPENVPADRWP